MLSLRNLILQDALIHLLHLTPIVVVVVVTWTGLDVVLVLDRGGLWSMVKHMEKCVSILCHVMLMLGLGTQIDVRLTLLTRGGGSQSWRCHTLHCQHSCCRRGLLVTWRDVCGVYWLNLRFLDQLSVLQRLTLRLPCFAWLPVICIFIYHVHNLLMHFIVIGDHSIGVYTRGSATSHETTRWGRISSSTLSGLHNLVFDMLRQDGGCNFWEGSLMMKLLLQTLLNKLRIHAY